MTEPFISDEDQIAQMIIDYNITVPKNWDEYRTAQRLEFIAHRMLLDGRTSTKHSDMKEEGWLSNSQLERRRRREVLSSFGSLDEVPPKRGVFSRTYRKPRD